MNRKPTQTDLPHSKESEMMVLGCMFSNMYAMKNAASSLEPSDFFFNEHKIIFQALSYLYQNNKPGEIHLAAEYLKKKDHLSAVGGVGYLASLAQFAGTSSNIGEYIEILKIKSFNRQAYYLLEEGKREFVSDPKDPSERVEKMRHQLTNLGRRYSSSDKVSVGEILSGSKSKVDSIPLIEKIEERRQYFKRHNKPFMTGIPTGFTEIDQEATLLEETNLIVLAARPSMGKTAFAINIANHVCIEKKKAVAIFSLEMGADQLVERFLSLRTGISGERIRRGELSNHDFETLKEQDQILRSAKLFIQDTECSSISQIIAKVRRLKEEEDISLVIIDYLQLLSVGGGAESRQYEIAEISRKLKMLAMEVKTPLICISQLSRKVEERRDHRPIMSDLRDSGQIEQDSDVVIFIQRREYYDPKESPGGAEIIVAKNRNGSALSSVPLHFDAKSGKFSSALQDEPNYSKPKPLRYYRPERFLHEGGHPLLR